MTNSSSSPVQLLPCPFCGSPARTDLLPRAGGPGWVQCSECECDQHMSDTLEEAVKRWNTRAALSAPLQYGVQAEYVKKVVKALRAGHQYTGMVDPVETSAADLIETLYLAALAALSKGGSSDQDQQVTLDSEGKPVYFAHTLDSAFNKATAIQESDVDVLPNGRCIPAISDDALWTLVSTLHSNVPEADQPMSWSDFSPEQIERLRQSAKAFLGKYYKSYDFRRGIPPDAPYAPASPHTEDVT